MKLAKINYLFRCIVKGRRPKNMSSHASVSFQKLSSSYFLLLIVKSLKFKNKEIFLLRKTWSCGRYFSSVWSIKNHNSLTVKLIKPTHSLAMNHYDTKKDVKETN